MIALEDIEIALEYLDEKKYDSAKLYLENVVRAEQEEQNRKRDVFDLACRCDDCKKRLVKEGLL